MLARDLRERQVLGDRRLVRTQNGIELTLHLSLFLEADRGEGCVFTAARADADVP